MSEITIDVRGETCPVPLVEVRKAIRRASPGDIVNVTGDHIPSKKEIPMAVNALGLTILNIKEEGRIWKIKIQR